MEQQIPAKYKVFAPLLPLLALMTVASTVMVVRWRSQYGRLAREKRGRTLALPFIERAREILDRAEKDLRSLSADPDDIIETAKRAIDSATDAMERCPEAEEASRIRARALEIMYNFDEARHDYEKALSLHPESPARFHLGIMLVRLLARARLADMRTSLVNTDELRDSAVKHLRRFQAPSPEFKFHPDEKLRFMCSAGVAYALGEYHKVAAHANTAATYDPHEWLMPFLRGLSAFEMGDRESALKDLNEALRIAPHQADALAWRGKVLGRLGRHDDAVASLTRGLQANRHFLEAYLVRAALLYEDGRYAEAREDFNTCAKLRPSLPDIHFRRGVTFYESWVRSGRSAATDLAHAEEALSQFLAACPKDREGNLYRARVRMGRGDLEGAARDISAAIEAGPDAAEARVFLAEIYEAQGKLKEAERECTAALEREGDHAGALRRRASVRAKAGRIDEALSDYDRLLMRDPSDAGLHLAKGDLQLAAGRADDALASADRGLAAAPRNARLLTLRAQARLRKGDHQGAVRDASAAVEIDPQHADAYVVRGRARLQLGDKSAALSDLSKALQMRPDLGEIIDPIIRKAGD